MIAINLLPEHLRPVKRTPLPYIFGFLFLAAALVGMAFVYLQNQSEIGHAYAELETNKKALEDLKPVVEAYNALEEEKRQLALKLETIHDIVRDRVIWSRQLHNINRLAPNNLWFEGISVENKPFKERVPYVDPRTGQTKEKTVRVDRPVLKLKGYVISVNGETPTISPLTLATEEDEEFSERFQLLTTAFADTTFESFPVRSFTLEYNIEFPQTSAADSEVPGELIPVESTPEESAAPMTEEAPAEPESSGAESASADAQPDAPSDPPAADTPSMNVPGESVTMDGPAAPVDAEQTEEAAE